MSEKIKTLLALTALFAAGVHLSKKLRLDFQSASVSAIHGDRIDTSGEPVQKPLEENEKDLRFYLVAEGYDLEIVPQAKYHLRGRVVSKFNYYMSQRNITAPVDLVVAWGSLAGEDWDSQGEYESQRNGFYHFRPKRADITLPFIAKHSANNHMIPATDNIRIALKEIDVGDVVSAEGYLVNLSGTYDGKPWKWNTSLTRDDTMGGACEVMYVRRLIVGQKVFE